MKDERSPLADKAQHYEINTRISIPSYDALFAMAQSYFRSQLREHAASLLIVGAGGGNELAAWGPSNPAWTFTGVDPSGEMLKIAEYKSVELGLESRIELIQGTIHDLPGDADPGFDAASCILVLHFIADEGEKLKLLRGIRERLKPGAPFVLVSAYGDRESRELQDRINVWKSFWLGGGRTPDQVNELGKRIMDISFIPEERIGQLLAEAGFARAVRFYSTGLFGGWVGHAD